MPLFYGGRVGIAVTVITRHALSSRVVSRKGRQHFTLQA
jgi:hypothetical protein